jgi:hypothetical protein
MKVSATLLSRHLRLALLLLLLASQGIANAHEQTARHSLDSHLCSVCIISGGLIAAVDAHPDLPQLFAACSVCLTQPIAVVLISHHNYYFTRAPPASL